MEFGRQYNMFSPEGQMDRFKAGLDGVNLNQVVAQQQVAQQQMQQVQQPVQPQPQKQFDLNSYVQNITNSAVQVESAPVTPQQVTQPTQQAVQTPEPQPTSNESWLDKLLNGDNKQIVPETTEIPTQQAVQQPEAPQQKPTVDWENTVRSRVSQLAEAAVKSGEDPGSVLEYMQKLTFDDYVNMYKQAKTPVQAQYAPSIADVPTSGGYQPSGYQQANVNAFGLNTDNYKNRY